MEDVLELYGMPHDENIPLVCMDEQPIQFLGNKIEPIEMKPGRVKKEDYEYERCGTCSIFMFCKRSIPILEKPKKYLEHGIRYGDYRAVLSKMQLD